MKVNQTNLFVFVILVSVILQAVESQWWKKDWRAEWRKNHGNKKPWNKKPWKNNGGGGAILSNEEFNNAITAAGYPHPRADQYQAFIKRIPDGGITTKQEACMFLANILWESGGLKYKREIACAQTGCPGVYDSSVGVPGKNYYGRGYIQLSHSYNYKPASYALYGDDRLIKNPDLVADDEDAAWGTAFWFWKTHVHNKPGIAEGRFGVSTRAINSMECTNNMSQAHSRFQIYKKILRAVRLNVRAIESGCYN